MPELPFAEAPERNKRPILGALREILPETGRVLEIGSGTGQHAVFFADAFPGLTWQPSDRMEQLSCLSARLRAEGGPNILDALELDVTGAWPEQGFDAVFSANTVHIMDWTAVRCMFEGVGRVLLSGGSFCLYGPFNENGRFTSAGNEAFDRGLRARDPGMGIRNREALESLARRHQMELERQFRLPANNSMLVFRRMNGDRRD